jgi:inosine-uridine nucleoside N-ribohydrolase
MDITTPVDGWRRPFHTLAKARPRVILDTDAKNEVDDQFAIVHCLLQPGFDMRGIVPSHFGYRPGESYTGQQDSRREVDLLLGMMGLEDKVRVEDGAAHAIPDYTTPVPSPGAELIVEEAMREDTDAPLYVAFLGPLTDMATALLMEPRIAERDVTVVWIGGPPYEEEPHYWPEYNLSNDVAAANVVFASEVKLWQIPMEVIRATAISFAELEERVEPCGELGGYLARQLLDAADELEPNHMGLWCLGDQPAIGVMINPFGGRFKVRPAPTFRFDGAMDFTLPLREIRTYETIDMRFLYEDFFTRLKQFARRAES